MSLHWDDRLQASLPAAVAIASSAIVVHFFYPPAVPRWCGPLPPRASSINLEDSEQFVQPDHDTSK
jgi:hypothetical protein